MANTSATGGILQPSLGFTQEDLENAIHDTIAGITGLDAKLVRPRVQQEAPAEPKQGVNWCAFGFSDDTLDQHLEILHDPAGDGYDLLRQHSALSVLASFYGPLAHSMAKVLIMGLNVPQNNVLLKSVGLVFSQAGVIVDLPEVPAFGWRRRTDAPFILNQLQESRVEVLNILSADPVGFLTDRFINDQQMQGETQPITVENCACSLKGDC
jgi:hypothetical protein